MANALTANGTTLCLGPARSAHTVACRSSRGNDLAEEISAARCVRINRSVPPARELEMLQVLQGRSVSDPRG